jgi:plastocyanin
MNFAYQGVKEIPSMRSIFRVGVLVVAGVALSSTGATAEVGSVSGTVVAKGLRTNAGVVVSLTAAGLKPPAPGKPFELDQKSMQFLPHVVAITQGTEVRFLNSDPVAHNVFSPDGKYNLGTWPQGQSRSHVFDKPGVFTQLCRVHPEMEGYIVVLDTPYFAITDAAGAFEIKGVEPGKYKLHAWSEKLKAADQEVTVEAGKAATLALTLSH